MNNGYFRAVAAVPAVTPADPAANLKAIKSLLTAIRSEVPGVDLVVMPELCITGYSDCPAQAHNRRLAAAAALRHLLERHARRLVRRFQYKFCNLFFCRSKAWQQKLRRREDIPYAFCSSHFFTLFSLFHILYYRIFYSSFNKLFLELFFTIFGVFVVDIQYFFHFITNYLCIFAY